MRPLVERNMALNAEINEYASERRAIKVWEQASFFLLRSTNCQTRRIAAEKPAKLLQRNRRSSTTMSIGRGVTIDP